jgi:hypothetical protein
VQGKAQLSGWLLFKVALIVHLRLRTHRFNDLYYSTFGHSLATQVISYPIMGVVWQVNGWCASALTVEGAPAELQPRTTFASDTLSPNRLETFGGRLTPAHSHLPAHSRV